MIILSSIVVIVLSFVATSLASFSGGGSGLFQLPILLHVLPFTLALTTYKLTSVFMGVGASYKNIKLSKIDFKIALLIQLAGLPGVIIGTYIILHINQNLATILLGILILSIAVLALFFKKKLDKTEILCTKKRVLLSIPLIFIIGVLNGSLTAGTGLLLTILLVYLFNFEYSKATANTLFNVSSIWCFIGFISILYFGAKLSIYWSIILILGSLSGGYFGACLTHKFPDKYVRLAIITMSFLIGVDLIVSNIL